MTQLVNNILVNLADNITDLIKTGFITIENLESTNRNKLCETHSIVWNALSNSVNIVTGKTCVIATNRSLKSESMKKRFTPDISIWDKYNNSNLVGVVDYESTNSSDSRIFRRNFVKYSQYVQTSPRSSIPEFWLIVTSLPSKKVSQPDWYSWDLIRKRISRDEYLKLLENPFEYWYTKYSIEFSQLQKQLDKCPLYLANMDFANLRICLPENKKVSIPIGI